MDAAASPRRKRRGSRLRGVATLAPFALAVALAAVVLVPGLLGFERYVITSGSMTGALDRGSLVFAEKAPVSELRVGDVITYTPPPDSGASELLTHRIVSVGRDASGRQIFRTKGDANPTADAWTFTLDAPVQARASFHIPYVGYALAALSDRSTRMLVIGLPALLIALSVLIGLWRDAGRAARQAPRRRTNTSAPSLCALLGSLVALAGAGALASAADFAAASANPGNAFTAAADLTPPSVSLADPGNPLRGTVTLDASASDAGSGIASVSVERRLQGSTGWTTVCTRTTSPYSCSLDTASGLTPDGLYELRAVATDTAGNSAGSTPRTHRIDNTPPAVTLSPPAAALRGTVSLSSTSSDGAGSGVTTVRYEYAVTGGTSWTEACRSSTAPFSCSFNTVAAAVADGRYDIRAVATDGAGFSTISAAATGRWIDNSAPTAVTIQDPGSPITGSRTLSGGATDAGSGVASLTFEYRPTGASAWSGACTATSSPYSCSWSTAALADGTYELRALATDSAGNATGSSVVTGRHVDNNAPLVTMLHPGSPVSEIIALEATSSDGQGTGTASVKIQYRAASATSWIDVCTDTTSPYTCSLNSKAGVSADGDYDFRAIATDNVALSANSAPVRATIDNTNPRGMDVQATNLGTKPGVLEPNDRLELRYSETMKPSSILAGWNGSATNVTVRVLDSSSGDRLEVWDAANTTRLNLIQTTKFVFLNANYVPASGATFTATMTQSGVTVFVTLNTLTAGAVNSVAPAAGTMDWNPSGSATDLANNFCDTGLIVELNPEGGVLDPEF